MERQRYRLHESVQIRLNQKLEKPPKHYSKCFIKLESILRAETFHHLYIALGFIKSNKFGGLLMSPRAWSFRFDKMKKKHELRTHKPTINLVFVRRNSKIREQSFLIVIVFLLRLFALVFILPFWDVGNCSILAVRPQVTQLNFHRENREHRIETDRVIMKFKLIWIGQNLL